MYYVNERWLGGMLTNFKTIQSRIKRLKEIETMSEDGTFDVLPKKEVIELKKEWAKLEKNLGGIKDMKRLPDAIFIVDPKKERICVQEAHTLGIPLIGICDTNCDPADISGSLDICSSPKLFAAYHVFHRLLVPRHPPYALSSITNLLRPRVWTPLHISSVICVGNSLLFLFVFSNQFSFLLLQASMITSDVLIFFLSFHFCMRFSRYTLDSFWNPMEITRFELVTSCLQGRRSPN